MDKRAIISLDLGTTSVRAIAYDCHEQPLICKQQTVSCFHPQPNWVEQCPNELAEAQIACLEQVLTYLIEHNYSCKGIGITNQRESCVVWNIGNHQPIYPAINWQCRRTHEKMSSLSEADQVWLHQQTGLVSDAYFSASKISWILDNVPNARAMAEAGELLAGTLDSWLIYTLTQGQAHITDATNACRTMLYQLHDQRWSEALCQYFNIPIAMLPTVVPSHGQLAQLRLLDHSIPLLAIIGDQQSALFGHQCTTAGKIKNTYGTGCFMLLHTGQQPTLSNNGLLTTIALGPNGENHYAIEGSVFMGGAIIQWLRDQLGIIKSAKESETLATSLSDNQGVYLIPAFTGLGAPHWIGDATAQIHGLTRATGKAHIARAGLEAIAYQVYDLFSAMCRDTSVDVTAINVDGGACQNQFLMQFQSDLLQLPLIRQNSDEVTAWGVAKLAGIEAKMYLATPQTPSSQNDISYPQMDSQTADKYLNKWHNLIEKHYKSR